MSSSSSSHSHPSPPATLVIPLPPYQGISSLGSLPSSALDTSFQRAPSPRAVASTRTNLLHPYARLYAKKEEVKRRKIWNHALEKALFSPFELSTLGAPHRRTIYVASLEAHVDRLHAQLLSLGFWPVALDRLEPFKGLNSKTAKSMVAGLQHDASQAKLKLLELQRANESLEKALMEDPDSTHSSGPAGLSTCECIRIVERLRPRNQYHSNGPILSSS